MSDMAERVLSPIIEAMNRHGISADMLAKQLKAEMRAKVTRTQKVKGATHELPRGFKCITTTGIIERKMIEGEVEKEYSDGESLIQWDEYAWDIRQRARMDAQKLLNFYPAIKHEHSGPDGGPIQHNHELHRALEDRLKDLEEEQ